MKRLIFLLPLFFLLASCGTEDDPNMPDNNNSGSKGDEVVIPSEVERTMLIYAVNNSSLASDFKDDSKEMLKGMETLDLSRFQLLVFFTEPDKLNCGLYRVIRSKDGKCEFEKIKNYERNVTSTSPERIKEVISDALALYPNSHYDMTFWGHGMSWKPFFTDHTVKSAPVLHSYGGEYNSTSSYTTDWTEIDELAAALPDHVFETIWFDCCYMSSVEVIYEFRNKCNTMVAYPTEVYQYGMNYDAVLPYLMQSTPDIVGGAKVFYDSYGAVGEPCTVAVIDMASLEPVADITKRIYSIGDLRPIDSQLLNYSRSYSSPFYDFGQFVTTTATLNGREDLSREFKALMKRMVVYHAESSHNFNLRPWDVNNISGVSTHFYQGVDTEDETYYRTLAWYKRVHTQD